MLAFFLHSNDSHSFQVSSVSSHDIKRKRDCTGREGKILVMTKGKNSETAMEYPRPDVGGPPNCFFYVTPPWQLSPLARTIETGVEQYEKEKHGVV